jgi:Fic family protein
MNLGAVQSKCEHVARAMVAPEISESLLQVYLAKGVQATTAIEGNTLSEKEVLARIRGKPDQLPRSKQYLGIEVDNVIKACNEIQHLVLSGNDSDCLLTVDRIRHFNRQVLEGLEVEDQVTPGELRTVSVGVGNYRGAPAEDCEYLLEKMCEWINHEIKGPDSERIAFGVIRAILAHLYIAWIHPFGDGNGRTARLIELQILLAAGVPNVAAHLLSNHYNATRSKYYRELDRASKSNGDVIPFLSYAVQGMFDGLNQAIDTIRQYQIEVTWRDYVYSKFKEYHGPAADRRRQLALDLWNVRVIAIQNIRTFTPELAARYAGKTPKTVARDLSELESMQLIERVGHKAIRARVSELLGFLPGRREVKTAE